MHALQPIGQSITLQLFALTQPELSVKAQSPCDPMPMYDDDYSQVPCTPAADAEDKKLDLVWIWMDTFQQPSNFLDAEYKAFMWYATGFFKDNKQLWQ